MNVLSYNGIVTIRMIPHVQCYCRAVESTSFGSKTPKRIRIQSSAKLPWSPGVKFQPQTVWFLVVWLRGPNFRPDWRIQVYIFIEHETTCVKGNFWKTLQVAPKSCREIWISSHPGKINMEPENHSFATENHFPNLHYCVSRYVFRGVSSDDFSPSSHTLCDLTSLHLPRCPRIHGQLEWINHWFPLIRPY